jgi:hypothetical protein
LEFGSLQAIKANGVYEGRMPKIDADVDHEMRSRAKTPP